MTSRSRAIATLTAFLVAVPLIAGGTYGLARRLTGGHPWLDQDEGLQMRLPAGWADPSVLKMRKVRAHREFWGFEKSSVEGTALRVLETPALREALFPGYPREMFEDSGLWRDYFTRDFAGTSWLPPLQRYSQRGLMVYQSWLGCMDVFRRYGADGVVFGSSETFRSLVPQLLSVSGEKVLMCTTNYSYVEQAEWLAGEMAKELEKSGRPKLKWALLGVSLWSFYESHAAFHSAQSEKKAMWDGYLLSVHGHYGTDFKLADLFHPPAWDDVFPVSQSMISRHLRRARKDLRLQREREAGKDPAPEEGEFLAMEVDTREKLEARLKAVKPGFPLLEGLSERECSDFRGDAILQPTVRALGIIAERTVLYVPPISPRLRETIPTCYRENFANALSKLGSAPGDQSISSVQHKAEDYGLSDDDYLYVAESADTVQFDPNHVNYAGAVRVTRALAAKSGLKR